MTDTHYIIYQHIDRHPVIFILMLVVIFAWMYDLSLKNLARVVKGDKSASVRSSFYLISAVMLMVGIIQVTMNHGASITGHKDSVAFIHEHRYDIVSEDSILHSPLCGCKQPDAPHPERDSTRERLNELIRKSMP